MRPWRDLVGVGLLTALVAGCTTGGRTDPPASSPPVTPSRSALAPPTGGSVPSPAARASTSSTAGQGLAAGSTAHPVAGVPAGTTLTPMSGTTITKAGTVISGRDITGTITVAAPGVVITRSKIHGRGTVAVNVISGSATISYSTITGFDNAVFGDNYTASHVEVTALLDDGFKLGSHVTIDSSWCHDLTPEAGAHSDCAQLQSGEVDVLVANSWLDPGSDEANSALFLAPDLGPSSNGPLTVTHNVLGGGNYALYCVDGDNGRYFVKNITISDNRFLDDSQYGNSNVNVPVTWIGNV